MSLQRKGWLLILECTFMVKQTSWNIPSLPKLPNLKCPVPWIHCILPLFLVLLAVVEGNSGIALFHKPL